MHLNHGLSSFKMGVVLHLLQHYSKKMTVTYLKQLARKACTPNPDFELWQKYLHLIYIIFEK